MLNMSFYAEFSMADSMPYLDDKQNIHVVYR